MRNKIVNICEISKQIICINMAAYQGFTCVTSGYKQYFHSFFPSTWFDSLYFVFGVASYPVTALNITTKILGLKSNLHLDASETNSYIVVTPVSTIQVIRKEYNS